MSDNQIVISNLSKVYDNGFKALKNINLNIKKGEISAISGFEVRNSTVITKNNFLVRKTKSF